MITESDKSSESPLKTLRDMLGMTQQEFAQLLGVAVSTVSRWERGVGRPSFTPGQWKRLIAAITLIGLSLNDLPDEFTLGNFIQKGQGS